MRKAIVFVTIVLVFLVLIFSSSSTLAHYIFLSDDSNIGLNILKEKYIESLDLNDEEHYDHGFIWGVIVPENEGKEIQEYTEIIEGKVYLITEITVINPQGPIKVVWGSASKNHPNDIPRIVVKH
jgi:hypothetical protein